MDLPTLIQQCAPAVHPDTMQRIVRVESSANPYAIGVVGGRLTRQPRQLDEAVATARWLAEHGHNYSAGLTQVNQSNFARHGLTLESAFAPCANLRAGAAILQECFERARGRRSEQAALQAAFSCYYSGNFRTGFDHGYVTRVLATLPTKATPGVTAFPIPLATGSERKVPLPPRRGRSLPPSGATPEPAPATPSDAHPSALLF